MLALQVFLVSTICLFPVDSSMADPIGNYGFNNSSYSKGCEDLLPYACEKGIENKFKNWKFLKQKKDLSDEEKKAATDSFCKDEYIYLTDHKNDCDKTCGRCK